MPSPFATQSSPKSPLPRSLEAPIRTDLDTKLVLLTGPRQTGKSTLSRALFPSAATTYLNFDRTEDREVLRKASWPRSSDLLIFDELHKMRKWKQWIKGIYDTEPRPPRLLVTGSARLDVYRRGGDSLAGRHFSFRLHPFSVAEALRSGVGGTPDELQDALLNVGGFPEPFLQGTRQFAQRWRRSHIDRILREDLLDLERVRELKSLEILVDLLADRVGGPVSHLSLARDLEVSPKTVKHWIEILERMYIVFVVTPYSRNLARAILKEPKIYFYDTGRVRDDPGARFENLVACSLLKRNHYLEDTRGEARGLHYVRDQQHREVDFLTTVDRQPELLIEAKVSDPSPSPHLAYFSARIPGSRPIQLVKILARPAQYGRIEVLKSAEWLAGLET